MLLPGSESYSDFNVKFRDGHDCMPAIHQGSTGRDHFPNQAEGLSR